VFIVEPKSDISNKPAAPVAPVQARPAQPASVASTPPRPEGAYKPAASAANGVSVIGRDLTILGDKITIVSQNKVQVDGDIRGDVYGKQVVITNGGAVVGLVRAERIEVHGAVRGAIRAVTVVLHSTAKVDGDIMHQTLGLAEGAQFEGRVQRADTADLVPNLDPEAISAANRPKGFM
jgi:cytoskeletal protein CcmA (bactofilin family)